MITIMKMNNKILTLALGVTFLCAGTLATFAQKYVDYTKDASSLAVGDTVVMIDGNPSHYLTGEKIPHWVYQKKHTIMQIGTKRFPNGVLLREIYSWVDLNYMYRPTEQPKEEAKPIEVVPTQPAQPVQPAEPVQPAQPVEEVQPAEPVQPAQPAEEVKEEERDTTPKAEPVPAFQRFSIGVRGGAASLMQDAQEMGNWKLGWQGMLDLQYAYYFARNKHPERAARHGILVDLSAGYVRSGLKANSVDSTFINTTLGPTLKTMVHAEDLVEKDGQVQVEVALMYSLLCKGFFFNIGPKIQLPVYDHYKQTIHGADIKAFDTKNPAVIFDNELVTGKFVGSDVQTKGKWTSSKLNLGLAADLGYEFKLNNGHALGIGLYADYMFKDFGYDASTNKPSLVEVIGVANKAAQINVLPATDTYAQKLNGFDCGLKVIYHFNFPKQF